MNRLEMLEAARTEAHDLIEMNSALPDSEYAKLAAQSDDEDTVHRLAKQVLAEALDDAD